MRIPASPSERSNISVKDFKSRFETMNSLSTYDAAVNKARPPKNPSSRSNTPITSRSITPSGRPDVAPESPISRHLRTTAATEARRKALQEKAKTVENNKADSLASGRVKSPTFNVRCSTPTRINETSKDSKETEPKTTLESPRSATVHDINSPRKLPVQNNDSLIEPKENSPKEIETKQTSKTSNAQRSKPFTTSKHAPEPKRKVSRKRATKAAPKEEVDSEDEHYPKSNKIETYTDQNEIEELNNAIEELLNENEKLKTDIEGKILDMKSHSKKIKEPDPQTSFYFNQQALLQKQAEDNRRQRVKNEKTKKRLDRKRREFQKLIFAASCSNMNMNMNNMNYAQRQRSEPKHDNSHLRKENKVLLAEIDGLQRELSATLHTLEKTEKERNVSRSQVIKCTSCIQLLAEEIEHLREKNSSLEKKLEDNEFEQEELLAEWSYKMNKSDKKCSDQEELIRDLQSKLSSLESSNASEAKGKIVAIDQDKRADADEKCDNILSEIEDDLTILEEEIDKVTIAEKKYEMEGNDSEVKAAQERKRLLCGIKADTEKDLEEMQKERKKLQNAMDTKDGKKLDEVRSEKRDPCSSDESLKNMANVPDNSTKREKISSRLEEVEARVGDYRKNQRSISVTPVTQSNPNKSSSSNSSIKNFALPTKFSPTNQSGNKTSSKNLSSPDNSNKADLKVPGKEQSEVSSKKIEFRNVSPPMTFRPTNNGQNRLSKENANNLNRSKTPNSAPQVKLFPPKPSNRFRLQKSLSNVGTSKKNIDSSGNTSTTKYRKEAEVATKSLRQPNGNFKIPGSVDDQEVGVADIIEGLDANYQKPR